LLEAELELPYEGAKKMLDVLSAPRVRKGEKDVTYKRKSGRDT